MPNRPIRPCLDGAQRLVGGHVALAVVVHGGGAVAVRVGAVAVAQHAGDLFEVVGMGERPVDVSVVGAADDAVVLAQMLGAAGESVVDPERAAGERDLVGRSLASFRWVEATEPKSPTEA